MVHLRKPLNLFWFPSSAFLSCILFLESSPLTKNINGGSDFRCMPMLHNILQIKITKLSKVIKILSMDSNFCGGGFYIIHYNFPKTLSVWVILSRESTWLEIVIIQKCWWFDWSLPQRGGWIMSRVLWCKQYLLITKCQCKSLSQAQVTVSLDSFLSVFSATCWTVTRINKVRAQWSAQSRLTAIKPQHTCPCPLRSHGWSWQQQVQSLNLKKHLIWWAIRLIWAELLCQKVSSCLLVNVK